MEKQYRNKEWLKEQYVIKSKTLSEIADLCGVSNSTIHKWVGKHDLPRRSRSESLRRAHGTNEGKYNDADWLRKQYVENERSAIDIAEECNIHHDTIYKRLRENDIERRSIKKATNASDDMGFWGREHPRWKEYVPFKTHHRDNYEVWEHQSMADIHSVYVHRLLAVAVHGPEALHGKEVHHKNGVKWDNRPGNIELLSPENHRKRHHEQGDFPQSAE